QPVEVVSLGTRHYEFPVSEPIKSVLSLTNRYAGTGRFNGAGTPWNTRPARSNREPWQGQKKPPGQFGPRSAGATSKRGSGAQPRWVHTPSSTRNSGRRLRCSLVAYVG